MSLHDTQKPWEITIKTSKNEIKEIENFELIRMEELASMSK